MAAHFFFFWIFLLACPLPFYHRTHSHCHSIASQLSPQSARADDFCRICRESVEDRQREGARARVGCVARLRPAPFFPWRSLRRSPVNSNHRAFVLRTVFSAWSANFPTTAPAPLLRGRFFFVLRLDCVR